MKNGQRLVVLAALLMAGSAMGQRGPVAVPKPLPRDLSPRVAPNQCGGFHGHFGPLDFRTINPLDKRVVEEYHFDMELRTFLSGKLVGRNRAGTSEVVGDFDYVLRAIPNHPAALLVMEQLGRKLKSEYAQKNEMPLECYYLRAFMIAPDDPVVRVMYGIYLAHRDRREEAIYNLDKGDDGLRTSGLMQHLVGLVNIHLQRYDRAQLNALRVKRERFSLDAVERQLRESGKWNPELSLPADDVETDVPSETTAVPASTAPAPAVDAAASAASAPR